MMAGFLNKDAILDSWIVETDDYLDSSATFVSCVSSLNYAQESGSIDDGGCLKLCCYLLFTRYTSGDSVLPSLHLWRDLVFRGTRARLAEWFSDCWGGRDLHLPHLANVGHHSCLYISILRDSG